jgi:hypothetical protein
VPTYIIADPDSSSGWTHIWNEQTRAGDPVVDVERPCLFALERVRASVHLGIEFDAPTCPETSEEAEGLLDGLVNANPDVIDDPKFYGFQTSNRLPGWSKAGKRFRRSEEVQVNDTSLKSLLQMTKREAVLMRAGERYLRSPRQLSAEFVVSVA